MKGLESEGRCTWRPQGFHGLQTPGLGLGLASWEEGRQTNLRA